MGSAPALRLFTCCTVASLGLIATPRTALGQAAHLESIVVAEGTLAELELQTARAQLLLALGRFDAAPGDAALRLKLTLFVRGPRALDASLLVFAADGTVLGCFRVRGAGAGLRALLPTTLERAVEDAARALGWVQRRRT
jgi:hypothetical protein